MKQRLQIWKDTNLKYEPLLECKVIFIYTI